MARALVLNPSTEVASMRPPKGRPRTAEEIVQRHFTTEDGAPFRTREWVLRNVRPRHKLGRTCVIFYDADVESSSRRDARNGSAAHSP